MTITTSANPENFAFKSASSETSELFTTPKNTVDIQTADLENFIRNITLDGLVEQQFALISLGQKQPATTSKDWFMQPIKEFIQNQFKGNLHMLAITASFQQKPYPADIFLKKYMDVVYQYAAKKHQTQFDENVKAS